MSGFVVGEKATVMKRQWKGPPQPVNVKTVKRVTKLFVELDDDSKWSIDDGLSYPKNMRPRFGGQTASFIEPGGTEDIQRRADAERARERILHRGGRAYTSASDSAKQLSDEAALQILAIWDADIEKRTAERGAAAEAGS